MLQKMKLNIESTSGDFKMNMDIGFGKLNLLAGMNGSGKTLVLKFAWFSGYVIQLYKILLITEKERTDTVFAELVQNVFDWTFDEPDDLNGTIGIQDEDRKIFNFNVTFKNGKLDYFNMDLIDAAEFQISNIQNIQFNSKTARTFDAFAQYLKIKKLNDITTVYTNEIPKLAEFFKLYDILWFEGIIVKLDRMVKNGLPEIIVSEAGNSVLASIFEGANSSSNSADDDDCILESIKSLDGLPVFVMKDGSEKKALRLSSGQQSMLMLTLFSN